LQESVIAPQRHQCSRYITEFTNHLSECSFVLGKRAKGDSYDKASGLDHLHIQSTL